MNTTIEITISPPDRSTDYLGHKEPFSWIFLQDLIQIRSILKYNKIGQYIIFPEFANFRLHYHGIITMNPTQFTRFNKHAIHKFRCIGFCHFKKLLTFKDKLKWIYYCRKEWHITQPILDIDIPIMKFQGKQTILKHIKN